MKLSEKREREMKKNSLTLLFFSYFSPVFVSPFLSLYYFLQKTLTTMSFHNLFDKRRFNVILPLHVKIRHVLSMCHLFFFGKGER